MMQNIIVDKKSFIFNTLHTFFRTARIIDRCAAI